MQPRLIINKSTNFLFLVASLAWTCRSFTLPDINQTVSPQRNWPLYGGEPDRSGFRHRPTTPTFRHVWTYEMTSAPGKAIIVANGVIVAPAMDGRIDFVDIETGKRLGRMKTEDRQAATCVLHDNILFIASRYGEHSLAAYALKSGVYLWQINAGSVASEPLITKDGIYISALYNHVDKYNVETGKRLWRFATSGQHRSSPAIDKNILVVGCDNGIFYAIDSERGELKWQTSLSASIFATPIIKEGRVFVGSVDSTFYALNLIDGGTLWTFRADRPIYVAAATDGQRIVFGSSGGTLYCLNSDSGEKIWDFKARSVISTAPLIVGDVVIVGSLDKHYYGVSLRCGEQLWNFETKGRIRTAPVTWGKYLIGGSEDKFLYAFSLEN